MTKQKIINEVKRFTVLVLGFFIMALGVALSTKANLGTSPVSSIPYVMSMILPFTMGQLTILMSAVYVLIQIALLRSNYDYRQLSQLAIAVIFGYFTDLSLYLFRGIDASQYSMQWLFCGLSVLLIGFGVFIEVKVNRGLMAGEGVMTAISQVTKVEFHKVKVLFDSFQVVIAIAISLVSLSSVAGVREGTVFAALFVGVIVKLYQKALAKPFDLILEEQADLVLEEA